MTSFLDRNEHRWVITITVDSARRVFAATGVNLLAMLDKPEELEKLAADPFTFVDVLFELVRPQAIESGVNAESFGSALVGQQIDDATIAFVDALIEFFPSARNATLRKVADRAKQTMRARDKALLDLIDTGKLDRALDEALTLGSKSTK